MSLGKMLLSAQGRKPPPASKDHDDKNMSQSPIEGFSDRARLKLVERIGASFNDDISSNELRVKVSEELKLLIAAENLPLNPSEQSKVLSDVINDVLGYGPIESLLQDSQVSEIMVNGTDSIYAEIAGKVVLTDIRFRTNEHLRRVIEKIVSTVGRRIDESIPMVDARLPDGSRVNAIIEPLAVDGPSLTIRKFSKDGLTADDLLASGSLTLPALHFVRSCVQGKLNIVISGGTGTGKTTFLNVMSSFIAEGDRIVTIEDAVELRLRQRHVIRLECRPPNMEGKGEIAIRDLVRNSLRMRPDRIIVGECRGGEALDMLQAMNTGHEGSLTTLHANTPRDAISRLETMVLLTGFDLPTRAIREQTASAVDLIVQLERLRNGKRVVSYITEVVGMEGEQITLNEIFKLHYRNESDQNPTLTATGVRPQHSDKLMKNGVSLDSSIFEGG